MFIHILSESLRSAVLITGLVVIMMMLIESFNIDSRGDFLSGLKRTRIGQVVISSFLGMIPGCMGGFASVSLYTHGVIGFGALVAMMIASSGDEAFVMLAMMPSDAVWIFLILFAVAVVVGILTDRFIKPVNLKSVCDGAYHIHAEDKERSHGDRKSRFEWKRMLMFIGVVVFIAALVLGKLEDGEETESTGLQFDLLSEQWMYWLFGILSLVVLGVLVFGNDHFVEEHLWRHIVVGHLPSIFLWSLGVLMVLNFSLQYLDISSWISGNTVLMIVLATLVGIIPESGPHLIFVTLYASGIVPLPVLLASCISQDGHASLPLIAESKKSFFKAKLINCIVAMAAGFISMIFI